MVQHEADATAASSSTLMLSSLLTGSMIRARTSCRNTSSPPAASSNPSTRYACSSAPSRQSIRENVIGSGAAGPRPSSPEAELQLTASHPLPSRGLQHLQLSLIMR